MLDQIDDSTTQNSVLSQDMLESSDDDDDDDGKSISFDSMNIVCFVKQKLEELQYIPKYQCNA